MKVKDFDNYEPPRRKPWLVIALVCACCFFAWRAYFHEEEPADTGSEETPDQAADGRVDVLKPSPIDEVEPSIEVVEPTADVDASALLARASDLEKKGNLVGARMEYLQLVKQKLKPELRKKVEDKLGSINIALVMTPRAMPEKVEHTVARGDSLQKIANKYGTTVLLIQKCNNLANPNLIRAGYKLKVFTGKFDILVSKKRNDLVLYMNGEFFKRYSVGTGKFGKTPEGKYTITDKIPEPVWWREDGKEIPYTGDPKGENILGTRWMAITGEGDAPRKGYGIHGTWDESSIGKAESAGCVRMRNRDVEELFVLVPMKTKVVVVE